MQLKPRHPDTLHALRFPSRRSAVLGTRAMVATSQPLAAQAGLDTLRAGGNAFDAAVAVAAALSVVEPTSTGLGGDCFCLAYLADDRRVEALNGSGRSPAGLDAATLAAAGGMPTRGPLTVTVPGAFAAWCDLVDRHGRLAIDQILAPAIDLAADGYPVSELIAAAWHRSEPLLAHHAAARRHFLPGGHAPRPGDIVRLPALAQTLRTLAAGGPEAFYAGPIADDIVDTLRAAGGHMSAADLAAHRSAWVTPVSTPFGELEVWECPPNGQGLAALIAIGVARDLDLGSTWGTADHVHYLVEAMAIGFSDARRWVADPDFTAIPVTSLLSEDHFARRRSGISRRRAAPAAMDPAGDDTVYVAVVDGDGNACSLINSNYMGFGSGIVAEETGIPLQNRGAGFIEEPGHPNQYAPAKRPYHTIIPALATRGDGSLALCFGVMGGSMQPQGHLQVIANIVHFNMDPQRALDAPRFQLLPDGRVAMEPAFDRDLRRDLEARGHPLVPLEDTPSPGAFGGGQIIAVATDGVRIGGSDPRKDGQAVTYC